MSHPIESHGIAIVNPPGRPMSSLYGRKYDPTRWLFHLGAYGDTHVMVWGHSVEDALDELGDYLETHAPGFLCDDEVNEAYKEAYDTAIAEGLDDEKAAQQAQEEAEVDTTIIGNSGHYINSSEWQVTEAPSRAYILVLQRRDSEPRAMGADLLARRAHTWRKLTLEAKKTVIRQGCNRRDLGCLSHMFDAE